MCAKIIKLQNSLFHGSHMNIDFALRIIMKKHKKNAPPHSTFAFLLQHILGTPLTFGSLVNQEKLQQQETEKLPHFVHVCIHVCAMLMCVHTFEGQRLSLKCLLLCARICLHMCMHIFAYMCVCIAHAYLLPTEASRRCLISWHWNYRLL